MERTEEKATLELKNLIQLGHVLLMKHMAASKDARERTEGLKDPIPTRVIAFVGAGVSSPAGLPTSFNLMKNLCRAFVDNEKGREELLEAELQDLYGDSFPNGSETEYEEEQDDPCNGSSDIIKKYLANVSVFRFAAAIGKCAYGRRILNETIRECTSTPTHRPLAYEILAHLAKHNYIDHFVQLNFDTILDDALLDELPQKTKIILGPRDLPDMYSVQLDPSHCFVVRPFGRLGGNSYDISVEDTEQYGPADINAFIEHIVFKESRDRSDMRLVLLLIGYRGAELAFRKFLEKHIPKEIDQQYIFIYVIDPADQIPQQLKDLLKDLKLTHKLIPIRLEADTAFELLEDWLRQQWAQSSEESKAWISTARHKIISKCCTYEQLKSDQERFEIELLLQAVKSRGFIHLGAFGFLSRLRNTRDVDVRFVLDSLLQEKVIEKDEWLSGDALVYEHFVPNYMMTVLGRELAAKRIAKDVIRANVLVPEWRVERREGRNVAVFEEQKAKEYVLSKFDDIESSPDIEIVEDATPEDVWIMGADVEPIESIYQLENRTVYLFEKAKEADGDVEVCGIWSTGEWLFSETGWAIKYGRQLLRKRNVSLNILITEEGGAVGTRSVKRKEVLKRIRRVGRLPGRKYLVRGLGWWEINRALTMVIINGEFAGALYMRRRFGRPTVSPLFIDKNALIGRKYVEEVWRRYWDRAKGV